MSRRSRAGRPNPQAQIVDISIEVPHRAAAAKAKVRRVVLTSSVAAVEVPANKRHP